MSLQQRHYASAPGRLCVCGIVHGAVVPDHDKAHLPDRDTTWGEADDAAWLWDDDRARRRADV